MKTFWLSFADGDKPEGHQFLGACVIDVTVHEAAAIKPEVMAKFPHAAESAVWMAAATRKAHEQGCNPGGAISFMEIREGAPFLEFYARNVLLDRATIDRIDAQIAEATHR